MKLKTLLYLSLTTLLATFASAQQSPSLHDLFRSSSLVDWAQFNFDPAHDGYNPFESILNSANVGNVTLKWSYMPSEGPVQGQPAIVNGVAYFVAGSDEPERGAVYALNADTGAFIWKYVPGLLFGPPAVANGMVYVSTNYVYALDANTGALVWQNLRAGGISTTVAGNIVYAQDVEFTAVDALDASTGTMLWQHVLSTFPNRSPAVANGVVYVSAQDGSVYALNTSTGDAIWTRQLGISPTPQATPYNTTGGLSVANGVVYVEAADPKSRPPRTYNVWALDANTGATIWKSPPVGTLGLGDTTTPAVANGLVYVGAGGGVSALNAGTGALIWQYGLLDTAGSPIVANGVVYAGSWKLAGEGTGHVTTTALDAGSGAFLWNNTVFQTTADVITTPAVVNGMIYGTAVTSGGFGAFGLPN